MSWPIISLQNDIWGIIIIIIIFNIMSVEIPYWRCVTSQIWVVLLIGHATKEICFNYSEVHCTIQIWAVTQHQYWISGVIPQEVILRGNQWWHREMSACFFCYTSLWWFTLTKSWDNCFQVILINFYHISTIWHLYNSNE